MSSVIICGSTQFFDFIEFERIIIKTNIKISSIITTGNIGVGILAEQYAARKSIPIYCYRKGQTQEETVSRSIKEACAIIVIGQNIDACSKRLIKEMRLRQKPIYFFEVRENVKKNMNYSRFLQRRAYLDHMNFLYC